MIGLTGGAFVVNLALKEVDMFEVGEERGRQEVEMERFNEDEAWDNGDDHEGRRR